MGFLDHTTNSIIVDAVLTERGRELLARNDGSFQINAFAFGDDEVDYSNIVKYGLAMGKEKIEKNTPVFEAQTNENLAIKHNNITLSSSNIRILYVPVLNVYQMIVVGNDYSNPATVTLNVNATNGNNIRTINILSTLQKESGETAIDANLIDTNFEIRFNSLLLSIYNTAGEVNTANFVDLDENLIATYQLRNVSTSATAALVSPQDFVLNGRQLLTFNIGIVSNLDKPAFEKFGVLVDSNGTVSGSINTYIEVTGGSSGSRIIIPIKIVLN
jgi:hypothetical protein